MYLVSGWVILQLAEVTFPIFELPLGAYRLVLWLLALGFPISIRDDPRYAESVAQVGL